MPNAEFTVESRAHLNPFTQGIQHSGESHSTALDENQEDKLDYRSGGILLRHGRDVHPTWVKSSIETLSNTRVWGFVVQGQSPKRTLTVTDERWLNCLGNQRP